MAAALTGAFTGKHCLEKGEETARLGLWTGGPHATAPVPAASDSPAFLSSFPAEDGFLVTAVYSCRGFQIQVFADVSDRPGRRPSAVLSAPGK